MFTLTAKMDQPRITLAWELLPASDGSLHAVNPDPRALIADEFPTSLCSRMLISNGGHVTGPAICEGCMSESRARQAEFDAEIGQ